jgi:glucose/arabinose dehydrogenase
MSGVEKLPEPSWQERMEDRFGGVEFRFAPMPWNWSVRWWHDDLEPFWWVHFGPFSMLLSLRRKTQHYDGENHA